MSVASNIAEGQGRLTKGEFAHFLGQSRGSLLELETPNGDCIRFAFYSRDWLSQYSGVMFRSQTVAEWPHRFDANEKEVISRFLETRNLKLETNAYFPPSSRKH